jgi:hypothetical protein
MIRPRSPVGSTRSCQIVLSLIRPEALDAFQAIIVGVASAGVLATGFEAATDRRASFAMLESGDARALASVPLLVFTAPFIILRNTVRGRRFERRQVGAVAAATVVAAFWGLACGRIVLDVLAYIGA